MVVMGGSKEHPGSRPVRGRLMTACDDSRVTPVRTAEPADAEAIGRLLYDFNHEYDYATPEPGVLAQRLRQLMATGDTAVLLTGDAPDGLALLRFRTSLWTEGLECYLAELYVMPDRRGNGLGRALMNAAIELARARGADYMELNTGEDDVAARALYESLGFSRTEGKADGSIQYYYEREL
jgi:ribosomal protein S18 acetylase RimI-like enzyme